MNSNYIKKKNKFSTFFIVILLLLILVIVCNNLHHPEKNLATLDLQTLDIHPVIFYVNSVLASLFLTVAVIPFLFLCAYILYLKKTKPICFLLPVYVFCLAALCDCYGKPFIDIDDNQELMMTGFLDFKINYEAARLFILEGDFEDKLKYSSAFYAALILAPISTIITVLLSTAGRFRHYFLRVFARDRVVICGLGSKGLELARELTNNGSTVFAIEIDENDKNIAIASEMGVQVVTGNAQSRENLKAVRINRAKYIIIITGDDSINMNILMHISAFLRDLYDKYQKGFMANVRQLNKINVVMHMNDPGICPILREKNVLKQVRDNINLKIVNIAELTARSVFINNIVYDMPVIDNGSIVVASDAQLSRSKRFMHYIIIGFDQYGQALALQAVKMTHLSGREVYNDLAGYVKPFDNENSKIQKIKITIFEDDILKFENFKKKYPALEGLCELKIISNGASMISNCSSGLFGSESGMDMVQDEMCEVQRKFNSEYQTIVFFTMKDDYLNLKNALYLSGKLKQCKGCIYSQKESDKTCNDCIFKANIENVDDCKRCNDIPFYIEMSDSQGLSRLIDEEDENSSWAKRIFGFGEIDFVFSKDTVLGNKFTKVARLINREYCGIDNYDQLSYELQDSNCQAADHAIVKFRTLGYAPVEITSGDVIKIVKKLPELEKNIADQSHNQLFSKEILVKHYAQVKQTKYENKLQDICKWLLEVIEYDIADLGENYLEILISKIEMQNSDYVHTRTNHKSFQGLSIGNDKLAALSRLEHSRWCAEKNLIGFKYQVNNKKLDYVESPGIVIAYNRAIDEIVKIAKNFQVELGDKYNDIVRTLNGAKVIVKDEVGRFNINLMHWVDLHQTEIEKDKTQVNVICNAYLKAGMLPVKECLYPLHKKAAAVNRELIELYAINHLVGVNDKRPDIIRRYRKLANKWKLPIYSATKVIIVAGSCSEEISKNSKISFALNKILIDFEGIVISGGTKFGIPELTGIVSNNIVNKQFKLFGYLPEGRKYEQCNIGYDKFYYTDQAYEYSMLEPLRYWLDIVAAGIKPENIRLLYYKGGKITKFELEIAQEWSVIPEDIAQMSFDSGESFNINENSVVDLPTQVSRRKDHSSI